MDWREGDGVNLPRLLLGSGRIYLVCRSAKGGLYPLDPEVLSVRYLFAGVRVLNRQNVSWQRVARVHRKRERVLLTVSRFRCLLIFHCLVMVYLTETGRYSKSTDRPTISKTRTTVSFPFESVRSRSSPSMKWTGCCFPSLTEMLDAYK